MNNSRTRKITEGAMLCALIGVLLVINRQLAGVFDSYLIWIIPLPLIIYSSKYGIKEALVVCASMVLLSFIVAPPTTIFFVAGSVLLGAVYGWGLKNNKSNAWLMTCAIIGSLVVTAVVTVIFAGFFGYDIQADIDMMKSIAASMNFEYPANWNIKLLIYGVIVMGCVMEGVLIHLLAYFVLKKLKMKFPQFVPLIQWRLPKILAVLFLVVLIGYVVCGSLYPDSKVTEIFLLLSEPAIIFSLFFGYLLVVIVLKKMGFQLAIVAVVVSLLLVPTIVIPLLALLGIVDSLFDLRGKVLGR